MEKPKYPKLIIRTSLPNKELYNKMGRKIRNIVVPTLAQITLLYLARIDEE